MADYDRGEMNIADYVALIQAPLAGIPKSDVDALVARCVREAILPRVYPQAWGAHSSSAGRGRADADYLRLG